MLILSMLIKIPSAGGLYLDAEKFGFRTSILLLSFEDHLEGLQSDWDTLTMKLEISDFLLPKNMLWYI